MKRLPWVLALTAWFSVGCGETISVPKSDTSSILSSESLSAGPTAPLLNIAFVVPERTDLESAVWEQLFRYESTNRKALVEVVRTEPGQQAQKIRDLSGRGISSVVIIPDPNDTETPQAIRELAAADIPIVLMNRDAGLDDPRIYVVRYTDVEQDAKILVKAAVEEARKLGFPDDGEALIITNGPHDEGGRGRVAGLEMALGETSLKVLPNVSFTGYVGEATKLLEPVLAEHPQISVILFEEEQGARAAATARSIRTEQDPEYRGYALAGFGHAKEFVAMSQANQFAALAQREPERLARTAFQMAWTLARGEQPSGPGELETVILRAQGPRDDRYFEQMPRPPVPTVQEGENLAVDPSQDVGGPRPRPSSR